MTARSGRFGLSCAISTPFTTEGAVDLPRFAAHARWVLENGCGSVTAFGTTGEGSSVGLSEREQVFGALKAMGLDFRRQVVGGVMAASLGEAVAQCRQILDADGRGLLLAPPFYFKNVSDDGLFAWHEALFAALGGQARDVILYNLPSVTAVPLSLDLITRLRKAFPKIIRGVKDSSGDWANAQALLAEHNDLAILIGDERLLAAAVKLGAEGSICGLANLDPKRLLPLVMQGESDDRVTAMVNGIVKHPVIPGVKSLIADRLNDPAWRIMRPPLVGLNDAQAKALRADFAA